jgi:hypothetical protein
MQKICFLIFTFIFLSHANATVVSGFIKNEQQQALSFASVLIKNKNLGTTANAEGFYKIDLKPGKYTIICEHIGYASIQKEIEVGNEPVELNFILLPRNYNLNSVTVRAGSEDPAYGIIRKTIKARPKYQDEYKRFQCEVYLKGRFNTRNYPKKILGQEVDFEDGDTSKRKTIFLSETVAQYSVDGKKQKIEVLSTKVSGDKNGYGFSNPQIISFYEENISMGGLNPRGFVSPIADNALNYYNYKFRGTFYENGIEVSRIEVLPKRLYEPLFRGYINIIENSWRIHSVDLALVKEQQLQLCDTLLIQQMYVQQAGNWFLRQQVLYPTIKILGFDLFGSFVQVYDKFDLDPKFKKGYFDNTILKFQDSSNKKTIEYWDTARPIPLLNDEIADYKKKDSLEKKREDPAYLDSLDKKSNKYNLSDFLITGKTFSNRKKKSSLTVGSVMKVASYNTVEGIVVNFDPRYVKNYEGRRSLTIQPTFRYGFSNQRFNADITSSYSFGKKYITYISVAGGSRVFQFNNANPISALGNTVSTLIWKMNWLKLYEAKHFNLNFVKGLGDGLTLTTGFEFQDREPLENTSFETWSKSDQPFTPNYPTEITSQNIPHHQASVATVAINWQPGARYIELPDRKINIGSKLPTFNLSVSKGINSFLGSDVDFTKWRLGITDNLNLKLGGALRYNIAAGGFLSADKIFVPDYKHFLGTGYTVSAPYLQGFQLMPFYGLSNKEDVYLESHIEYHLNGLITNKLPLLRKWNWFFVVGGNGLNFSSGKYYYEAFFSIENILKVLRVDFIQAVGNNGFQNSGIRVHAPLR